ncbi:MAG: TIGR00730 family Rossman fold protein [Candidatus Binatia bacterium]
MRRLCVFCGSSAGTRAQYAAATRAFADELLRRGIGLVYGGGAIGLMGVVADAMLAGGGEVIGVIPRPLATREIAHAGCTELRVVESMHERKAVMASLADGFVALPGGLGTFEELLEMLTWTQLGVHAKPVAVLDVSGYWTGLRRLLDDGVEAGFVRPENADMLLVHDEPSPLLDRMAAWTAPALPRLWLRADET